jgi:hypothetical protein
LTIHSVSTPLSSAQAAGLLYKTPISSRSFLSLSPPRPDTSSINSVSVVSAPVSSSVERLPLSPPLFTAQETLFGGVGCNEEVTESGKLCRFSRNLEIRLERFFLFSLSYVVILFFSLGHAFFAVIFFALIVYFKRESYALPGLLNFLVFTYISIGFSSRLSLKIKKYISFYIVDKP